MLLQMIDGKPQGEVASQFGVTRSRANALWLRACRSFANLPVADGFWKLEDTPVEELYLPCRAERVLKLMGAHTLRQVTHMTVAELLREPNLGRGSVRSIQEALATYGVGLSV